MLTRPLIAVLLSVAIPATTAGAEPSTNGSGPAAQKPKRLCRDDTPIGSLIQKRICHTPEEWNQIDGANERAAHDTADQMRQGTVNNRPS